MRGIMLATAVLAFQAAARAQPAGDERILGHHSDITVAADGWLTVTETIRVRATGKKIKHAIYRDFLMQSSGGEPSDTETPFEVVKVQRNAAAVEYHIEELPPCRRVYIGSPSVLIPPGLYTFSLTYRTTMRVQSFADHDEFVWDAAGQGWDMPVDEMSATVTLPAAVKGISHNACIGPRAGKGHDCDSTVDESGRIIFRTTRPLVAGEGFSFVVALSKGAIPPPVSQDRTMTPHPPKIRMRDFVWLWEFKDKPNTTLLAGSIIGAAVVAAYYLFIWIRIGPAPPRGTITPSYAPPADLCPASVRYLRHMRFHKECLTVAIVDLAVRKGLTIDEWKGSYTLVRNEYASPHLLPDSERLVAENLFDPPSRWRFFTRWFAAKEPGPVEASIDVTPANHTAFRAAAGDLRANLESQLTGRYIRTHARLLAVGTFLSCLIVVGISAAAFWFDATAAGVIPGSFAVVILLLASSGRGWAGAILIALLLLAISALVCFLPYTQTDILWLLLMLVVLPALQVCFRFLLKRPTPQGRRMMDEIEGFKMYLATVVQDPKAATPMPPMTPELFEQYLPYALALGVHAKWAQKFAGDPASTTPSTYQPPWYRGLSQPNLGAVGFTDLLAGPFSKAILSGISSRGAGQI